MAGIVLTTAGVTIGYAVETEKGVRPVSGYTVIHDLKEVPDFNPEPEGIESTDLEATEYKTYVDGLKDMGGALGFLANFTQDLQTAWDALVTAYDNAAKENKHTWFEIKHPGLAKSVFFRGKPSKMGLPSMSVNSILETTVYITPTGEPVWETKSTT
jgi:hypothetical protein